MDQVLLKRKLVNYRKTHELNQEQMAAHIGIAYRTYQEIERTGVIKKADVLNKIAARVSSSVTPEVADQEQSYTDKRREHKNTIEKKEVPVYGGYSSLGNITVYDDDNLKNTVIGTLPPNIFPNCDYAEKAKGDSMYPLIMNQALLVGKKCSPKGISYGEKYIIKTKDGLDTTKFVHPVMDDNKRKIDGKVLLVAHNKSVPAQEIDIEDIIFSCRVHWIVNPT